MNPFEIQTIFVAGAGNLGTQIALQCAMHACDVILYDLAPGALDTARQQLLYYTDMLTRQGRLTPESAATARARIRTTADLQTAAAADLVSESVPEDPALKARVFAELNAVCPPRTIFTTNTSSLLPSLYADATGRPAQFAAMHFHSYTWDSNVVDLMPHPGTSPETMTVLTAFAHRIGQIPIVLRRESSGYVFNVMLGALNGAALTLASTGVASVEDIDRAWMGVMKTDVGPFGIMDFVGLKTLWDIAQYWATVQDDPALKRNADFIKSYLDRGALGVKNGKGFYTYPHPAYREPDFLTGEPSSDQ